jgi:fermentation-respiration switch protein FrsA (DUF1100 family)
MRLIRRFLLVLLLAYAAVCALMFFAQRKLLYFPDPAPMNPAAVGLPQAEVLALQAADGERLVAWWIAPRADHAPVFVYLHGNGANLQARAQRFARLTEGGAGLLALSWRGYGGSSGNPSEAGLLADAQAAYQAAAKRVPAQRLVLYGESLGTTVATMLAARELVAALVLDSGFASALDVAQRRYPWLPVAWLLRDPLRADLAAPQVSAPAFQVHCEGDAVTPLASARRLNETLPHARPLLVLAGGCHVPPIGRYEDELRRFIADNVPRRQRTEVAALAATADRPPTTHLTGN